MIDVSLKKLYFLKSQAALRNLFVADSLAMPVHWYYQVADIYKQFPDGINRFEPAPAHHPSSIMSLHSTSQGGRKSVQTADQEVVGDVILKGKAQFWDQANIHYHHDMPAGENTLNAFTVMWLLDSIAHQGGQYNEAAFLRLYIQRMTAETPAHPDTYAESYHRGFFANLQSGKPPHQCAAITHDTASIGGLVRIGPLALHALLSGHTSVETRMMCSRHLQLTHPDHAVENTCSHYVDLITKLLDADTLQAASEAIEHTINTSTRFKTSAKKVTMMVDSQVIGQKYSKACYINDAWPAVLYLALKYLDDPKQALLANTNLGGDNVHRGAVLGFILGLATANDLSGQFGELRQREVIETRIADSFGKLQKNEMD